MAGDINYKQKYQELKAKYMQAVDMAFRLGHEEGSKQAAQDQMAQQQQQQAELEAAAAGGMPGQPGADPMAGPDQPGDDQSAPPAPGGGPEGEPAPGPMAESEHPDGTELDQHISKLESMLKGEVNSEDLAKAASAIRDYQNAVSKWKKQVRLQSELKKSAQAIPEIAKALHRPKFKLGVQAAHNLSQSAKNAVTMQHKIVTDIMTKWEQEEKNASKDVLSVLNIEGLTKKE